jgi:molybdate transport system regulatory protein
MKAGNKTSGARLRVVVGPDIAIGPGKADLLEGIRETGSIAAAGRAMGMSYKRAWHLVETMNRCFTRPLVAARRGGRTRGGAVLTEFGCEVLTRYRRMEMLTAEVIEPEMAALRGFVADRRERT